MKFCSNCGAELSDNQDVCVNCGSIINKRKIKDTSNESLVGWIILGLIIPVVGIILYFVWSGSNPKRARAIGIASLIGFSLMFFGMHFWHGKGHMSGWLNFRRCRF